MEKIENVNLESMESKKERVLVDEKYADNDPRKWVELVRTEEESTYNQYLNNLGLSENQIRGKRIVDIGAGHLDFAGHCAACGINEEIYSIEPQLLDHEGILAAQKMHWGNENYEKIRNKTVAAKMEKMPFADESFDLAVVHAAVPGISEKWEDIEALRRSVKNAFEEILRILKSGGEVRIYPLPDFNDEYKKNWRIAIDEEIARLNFSESCQIIIDDVKNRETGEIEEGARLILKKIYKLAKDFPTQQELEEYISRLKENGSENCKSFEIKKLDELPWYDSLGKYFESKAIKGIEDLNIILIDDENFWQTYYGSNDSKSSYKPKTIILKKEIFGKENLSFEEISWLAHELGHIIFYDKLGDDLERYMDEYYKLGKYTDSEMERQAFEMQFEFLKSKGVSKEEVANFMNDYLDKSFPNDPISKTEELKQIIEYIDIVY